MSNKTLEIIICTAIVVFLVALFVPDAKRAYESKYPVTKIVVAKKIVEYDGLLGKETMHTVYAGDGTYCYVTPAKYEVIKTGETLDRPKSSWHD